MSGRVLLIASTTGYQAREFAASALRLGLELTLASDRCDQIHDPWGDRAEPVRFDRPRVAIAALRRRSQRDGNFDGIVACGDAAAELAAHVAVALGLKFHPPGAAALCRNKWSLRNKLRAAGLPQPVSRRWPIDPSPAQMRRATFPCVIKPLALSGSRGVMRADNPAELEAAVRRLARLLRRPEFRGGADGATRAAVNAMLCESFVAGREFALEGWFDGRRLHTFAIFEKPDPLDGPFFEETIYLTPPRIPPARQAALRAAVAAAASALGLGPGPVHAEARLGPTGPVVLEVAARPIGGLCARALRFAGSRSLEEVLLRAALGAPLPRRLAPGASGVMMIPIPGAGVLDRVEGVAAARRVAHITGVEITARPNQTLEPLPEGATYLGFIFARAATPAAAEKALRAAHARLRIHLRSSLPVLN